MGIELLPVDRRKRMLLELAEQMFLEDFAGQCLPFDCEAAKEYSRIVVKRQRKGRPISVEDAQIADIARVSQLTLATRNVKDFFHIEDLNNLNPWTDGIDHTKN